MQLSAAASLALASEFSFEFFLRDIATPSHAVEEPQHKRFRQNLADAYLAGQVTAARAASLLLMLRQQELLVWKIWPGWEARMLIDPSGESS